MWVWTRLNAYFPRLMAGNRRFTRRIRLPVKQSALIERLEQRIVLTVVTGYEQYFLELMNRARANPTAEAARLGIDLNEGLPAGTIQPGARQPLALNDNLQASIEGHLADELAHNYFAHTGFDGSTPVTRIDAAGYTGWFSVGENIAWEGTTGTPAFTQFVTDEYNDLFKDTTEPDRGHRINILDGDFQEVGSAVQMGSYQGYNSVLTGNDFGVRPGNAFLTGVIYTDAVNANNFYDVGEGIGGASVVVKNAGGTTFNTTANAAGGYQIALSAGTYTVTFSGTGISSPIIKSFTIGSLNVEVDANTNTDIGASGPPTLSGTNPMTYLENATASPIDSSVSVADTGRTTLSTATITIGNFVAGQDVLGLVPNSSTMGNIAITSNVGGSLQLSSAGSIATLAQWQVALRAITYSNSSDNPSTAARTVTFVVDDGTATNHQSTSLSTSIAVTAVNDRPVVSAIETMPLTYKTLAPATAISSALALSDPDDASMAGAIVQITSGYLNGADLLNFVNTAKITGNFNAATGILTLTGNDTVANYQAALRSVTYADSSSTPTIGLRTVNFQANDGHATNNLSNIATRSVDVTNGIPPVIAGVSATAMGYTENDPATKFAAAIGVTDSDSVNLSGATIQITGNYTTGQDRLAVASIPGVTATFNATTGTLSLSGSTSVAAYQTILQSVIYQNVSDNPNTATRTVSITVIDDKSNFSNVATRSINVTAVNDPPILSAIESTALAYRALNPAIAITSSLLVAEPDDVTLSSATVQITNGYQNGADVLTFVNTAKITATFNAATGTLTLSGIDSVSNYRTALRSVMFVNTSATLLTGTRTIAFQANDGHFVNNLSNVVTRSINVTNGVPPVIAGASATVIPYTENDPATHLVSGITVTDSDSVNLSGAIVQITGNYATGQDRLAVASISGVTATFNATTGTLSLSGSASLAAYQTILQSVTYQNISDNPNTATRTVTLSVIDDKANVSNFITRNISVTAVNDPPMISTVETATLTYRALDPATGITSTLLVAEPDDTTLAMATVQITTGYQSGADVLTFANTAKISGVFNAANGTLTLSGIDSVSNYRTALRSVMYANSSASPVTGMRTISFQANDGHATNNLSNVATRSVNVTNGIPPVIAGVPSTALAYRENDPATRFATAIGVTDSDSVNLSGATIQITGNYTTGQDRLAIASIPGVTATFNATTGTLSLSGSASVAAYQTILQSLTYQNVSDNPNTATRTVSITVIDDKSNFSNVATRSIDVTAVNDPPILSAIESTALAYSALNPAIAVTSSLLVAEPDDVTLSSATVQITNGYQNGADVLTFVNTAKITATFNAATGTLTLSGIDSVSNYRTALRSVMFVNTSAAPLTGARTIAFQTNDGHTVSNLSNIVTRVVNLS